MWWAETEDKRRPVLVVTRSGVIPALKWIMVAPITKTIRDIPTEVRAGLRNGLPVESVATIDNLQPIHRSFLTERVGSVTDRWEICRALSALADC
ncbi:MAG: type II toxin-antitoxin system PemK/MazF family toxin [Acidimicrobiia bacterium]|nr:type II toxin-antitoxin system PemK/MazF family toxin [Acidimicrobiia bacterium]